MQVTVLDYICTSFFRKQESAKLGISVWKFYRYGVTILETVTLQFMFAEVFKEKTRTHRDE